MVGQYSDVGLNLSTLSRETIERNDSCYEIYYENDVAADNAVDTSALIANYLPAESFDADGDVAFGSIIVRELQKMTPNAKREFKRNVTQMLFS